MLTSCGWGKLSEFNEGLEKLEEFNEKYADVEEYERDRDDEYRDQDLYGDFGDACAGDDWDAPYYEKEYPLNDEDGNFVFPDDLAPDTTLLVNDCIKAGEKYIEYLEWDYTKNNISSPEQTACLQPKIDQTREALSQFKQTNSKLSARYASLPLKFIAAEDVFDVIENRRQDYEEFGLLHLDYGKLKISMITDATLHLLTKDKCIETWIAKDVLDSLDPGVQQISDWIDEATTIE